MPLNLPIRKILLYTFWSFFGTGVLVLLIAAVRIKQEKSCTGISVAFSGEGTPLFLNKEEVTGIITEKGKRTLKGDLLRSFDLQRMEEKLEQKPFVADAELYFDNQQLLHVKVRERVPVARVFTTQGTSFFLDSGGRKLPLQARNVLRLPIISGYPYTEGSAGTQETQLIRDLLGISQRIQQDPFLMALIAQVDCIRNNQFELTPIIGGQVIEWGDGTAPDEKCKKLQLFYHTVIRSDGLDRYERIKLQYKDQVVGVRKRVPASGIQSAAATNQIKAIISRLQADQLQQAEQATQQVINIDKEDRSSIEQAAGLDKKNPKNVNQSTATDSAGNNKQLK